MQDVIDHRDTRREYVHGELHRADLDPSPFRQFSRWLDEAHANDATDATAMTLCTADAQGRPAGRIVLLKHFDAQGFCWYTDKRSPKGQELKANPWAELVFFWSGLDRQVRIGGWVEELPETDNEAYFNARPLGSRLSAAASYQSAVLSGRDELENRVAALERQHADSNVPRNPAWGGFRLVPDRIEFWQGRPSRLHDRFRYRRDDIQDPDWIIERLSP